MHIVLMWYRNDSLTVHEIFISDKPVLFESVQVAVVTFPFPAPLTADNLISIESHLLSIVILRLLLVNGQL